MTRLSMDQFREGLARMPTPKLQAGYTRWMAEVEATGMAHAKDFAGVRERLALMRAELERRGAIPRAS